MRGIRLAVVLTGLGLLTASASVRAHHAFAAEFDAAKPLKMRGALVKWEMVNPHSWFHIEVKQPDGRVETWMVEGGSPNQLIRLGVTKKTLAIGAELLIDGYQAKDGTNKAVGRSFSFADGQKLFLGGSAPPLPNESGSPPPLPK